eukprot:m.72912 g.72912  ORF g.72912 m.72912 type:complete len:104 (-) comp11760_c0_seq3:87-398(-)
MIMSLVVLFSLTGDHTRPIFDVDWSKSNNKIATACGDNNVRVFSVELEREEGEERESAHLQLLQTLKGHKQDVNGVAWCEKNSNLLASASDDETVIVWHLSKE